MLKVLSLTKIPETDPPHYELRLYDSAENNRGYVLFTENASGGGIRQKLREVGMSETEIDLLFARCHSSDGKRKNA
jgi:hypothetical protein